MSNTDILLRDASEEELVEQLERINFYWHEDYCELEIDTLDDSVLIDEMTSRGYEVFSILDDSLFLENIYQKIINNETYHDELHQYLKRKLGKAL